LVGKLMMLMAPKGHFLGQIPQPMHNSSEMKAIFDAELTSMQSFPEMFSDHFFKINVHSNLTHSDNGTRFLAFLSTFFGFALIRTHNRYSSQLVRHIAQIPKG
jgi:hypothetical protein